MSSQALPADPALSPRPPRLPEAADPTDELPLPAHRAPITRPAVSAQQAAEYFQEYLALEEKILTEADYVYFVKYPYRRRGETEDRTAERGFASLAEAAAFATKTGGQLTRRKKKSACRKLATFFNLSLPAPPGDPAAAREALAIDVREVGPFLVQTERHPGLVLVTYMSRDLEVQKVTATVTIQAPNGRTQLGTAACALSEGRGFKHPDHDLAATAFTRALNRAILDMIGWGEVSAEEIAEPGELPAPSPAPPADLPGAPPGEAEALLAEARRRLRPAELDLLRAQAPDEATFSAWLRQRLEAPQAPSPAPADEPPRAAGPALPADLAARRAGRGQLLSYANQLGVSIAAYQAYLAKKYGVSHASELTDAQLQEELDRFTRRYQDPGRAERFRAQCQRLASRAAR